MQCNSRNTTALLSASHYRVAANLSGRLAHALAHLRLIIAYVGRYIGLRECWVSHAFNLTPRNADPTA